MNWGLYLFFILALTLLAPCTSVAGAGETDDLIAREIVHEGIKRRYYIHAPASYDPGRPTAAVFVFHHLNQSAVEMSQYTGFNTISQKNNFLVIYPEAVKGAWNDGRKVSWSHMYDDLGFIDKLLDRMELKWNIDRSRVYACGMGNGGFFCQSLALARPDQFAAVSVVAATMPDVVYHKRKPLAPISMLFILGMKDPVVPFEGGEIDPGKLKKSRGVAVSASKAIGFWVQGNKCKSDYEEGVLPDLDPTDGTTVRWLHYKGCSGKSEVVLLAVQEGGHTWPGARKDTSTRKYGLTCKDFDATREIWRFFSKHRLAGSR